jgi:hypothetical protein
MRTTASDEEHSPPDGTPGGHAGMNTADEHACMSAAATG